MYSKLCAYIQIWKYIESGGQRHWHPKNYPKYCNVPGCGKKSYWGPVHGCDNRDCPSNDAAVEVWEL